MRNRSIEAGGWNGIVPNPSTPGSHVTFCTVMLATRTLATPMQLRPINATDGWFTAMRVLRTMTVPVTPGLGAGFAMSIPYSISDDWSRARPPNMPTAEANCAEDARRSQFSTMSSMSDLLPSS